MAGKRVISAVLTLKDRNFASGVKKATGGTQDFQRKVQHTKNEVKEFGSTAVSRFSSVAKGAAGMAAGMATLGAAGAAALGGLAMKAVEATSEITKFSQVAGMSTDGFQQWDHVMKSYGYSVEQASGDLAALAEKAMDASNGVGEGAELFGKLGVAVTDSSGALKTQEQLFNETITALQGMENQTERNAIATALLSTTGEELAPVLNMTSKELDNLKGKANVISEEDLAKSEKFRMSLNNVKAQAKGFATELGVGAIPYLQRFVTFASDNMPAIQEKVSSAMSIASGALSWVGEQGTIAFNNIKSAIDQNQPTIDAFKNAASETGEFLTSGLEKAQPYLIWMRDEGLPLVVDAMASVADGAMGIYETVTNNWSTIGPLVYGIVGAMAAYKVGVLGVAAAKGVWKGVTTGLTIAQALLNGTLALSPLGWIAIAIGAVIAVGILLWQNWDTIREKGSQLWTSLTGSFSGIQDGFSVMWSGMKAAARVGVNYIIDKLNAMITGFNNFASIKIPDWVPGIGGKGFEMNVPTIPKFAQGTSYFRGGLAQINERGGEIVDLPNGSRVYPHDRSVQMARSEGGSVTVENINIYGANMTSSEIINELVRELQKRLNNS
ncbi:hypothetical protein [Jeotgalibacillus terrae]|uniref:Phage tail tape measure protein n=1 Tax=Jeotgalibacillus terrae TaxID=587735 RepID=A0ABW5ZEG1_9BACL|nr:hypothetical protein [Jeotgalibacillus terrae]MBM7577666.1 hypothetical protein [Jeotgalibacillus terrae]